MKKGILFLAMALFIFNAISQDLFRVINVNGEIIATNANLTLESGLEVSSDENFDFIIPQSRAAMINSELGRIILTEQNATEAFSRAAFAPVMSSITTRGTSVSNSAELSGVFCDNMLIIDNFELLVGKQAYPMGDDSFFYINYIYNDEPINKRLPFEGERLIIDKTDLFIIDGKPIDHTDIENLKLFYYRKLNIPESILVADFNAVFVESGQIKPEITIIVEELKTKPFETITSEVHDYLKVFYGVADRLSLESWLEKEFNLKGE